MDNHHHHHSNSASSRLNNGSSSSSNNSPNHLQPSTPNKRVNFGGKSPSEERKREKFLTAKYGAHQMALIRKRLRVEMWMYDQLQKLNVVDELEIDLDEVLDMEQDEERRIFISNLLRDTNAPQENKNIFVNDLLEKIKIL